MAFHLTPSPGDPGEPQVRSGRVGGAEAGEERRLIRDGAQVLSHGSLICPECDLPLAAGSRLPATGGARCPYCAHEAEARSFVQEDVFDTLANEVYLVARVA